jgi:hypothetical protein
MRCPECGSEVDPGERFCGNCGAPIEWETATPEQQEPTPSGEATDLLDAKAKAPGEGIPAEDHDLVPAPPLLPNAEKAAASTDQEPVPPADEEGRVPPPAARAPPAPEEEPIVPPPEEEPIVPPHEEEMVPPLLPSSGAMPPPVSPMPSRQGQGTRWVWIVVAIVVAILAVCCCASVLAILFVTQWSSTSMIVPSSLPLLMYVSPLPDETARPPCSRST